MEHIFLNGPVQNGNFTFVDKPGKAVGIRIAAALNEIMGLRPPLAPHLWNTVMLANDVRHRKHVEASPISLDRHAFEVGEIARKYVEATFRPNRPEIVTDADPEVAELALSIIERHLAAGNMAISSEAMLFCKRCDHMAGASSSPMCKACGGRDLYIRRKRLLTAPAGKLAIKDLYGRANEGRIRAITGEVPGKLVLSRTRDYGISLDTLGLPGLVLDPRAGIHVAASAVARRSRAKTAVLLLTPNAAVNIQAYGHPFRRDETIRLLYGLHGHIPTLNIEQVHILSEQVGARRSTVERFLQWFLPLLALKHVRGLRGTQLPPLLRYFKKTLWSSQTVKHRAANIERVREAVAAGQPE
ncbi:MAG: hypothetical protein ACRD3Q_21125, partial [Terriglobales bacterium]